MKFQFFSVFNSGYLVLCPLWKVNVKYSEYSEKQIFQIGKVGKDFHQLSLR